MEHYNIYTFKYKAVPGLNMQLVAIKQCSWAPNYSLLITILWLRYITFISRWTSSGQVSTATFQRALHNR